MNFIVVFLLTFLWTFICFLLLRFLHWFIVKNIFYKYILWDSLIYSLYFSIFNVIVLLTENNDKSYVLSNWLYDAIFFILFFVIIPVLYNTFKGKFLKKHLELKTIYYPIIEFLIFITWFICAGSIQTFVFSNFIN